MITFWAFILSTLGTLSGRNSIDLNSIQTLCLERNTPLIFGDLVPLGNPNWNFLLILLQIINSVFSPVITYGMTFFFQWASSAFQSGVPSQKVDAKA